MLLAVVSRLVIHYGYVFDYVANDILREYEGGAGVLEGLPVEEQTPWSFVTDKIRSSHPDVNQCTVNSYLPGQVRGCEERSDELIRRVDEILALIADT